MSDVTQEAPEQEAPAVEAPPEKAPAGPSLMPPYLVVLVLVAGAAVFLAQSGAEAYHQAREAGAFPLDVRQQLVFSLLFSVVVGAAFALAFLGECIAAVVRWRRGLPLGRVLLRWLLALLPLVVLVAGHLVLNPWLEKMLRDIRPLLGQLS